MHCAKHSKKVRRATYVFSVVDNHVPCTCVYLHNFYCMYKQEGSLSPFVRDGQVRFIGLLLPVDKLPAEIYFRFTHLLSFM